MRDSVLKTSAGLVDDLLVELDAHIFGSESGLPSGYPDIEGEVSTVVRHEFGDDAVAGVLEVAAIAIVRDRARHS